MDSKPLTITELSAKAAAWPPQVYASVNKAEADVLLVVTEEDNSANVLAVEMCSHGALSLCCNLIISVLKHCQMGPDERIGLGLASSMIAECIQAIPDCKGEVVSIESKGRVN